MSEYHALEQRLGLKTALPISPGWSAEADFLQLLAAHCLQHQPGAIVECGSGASTIVLARCCQLNRHGQVISLEHDAGYATATRQALAQHDLQDYAQVLHAPLVVHPAFQMANDSGASWYSLENLAIPSIDMLVIDGPPAWENPLARHPALPLLRTRLAAGCTIYLDDAARAGERDTVRLWLAQYSELRAHYLNNQRGCSVLAL